MKRPWFLHVTFSLQLDASELDIEIEQLLRDQLGKVFRYFKVGNNLIANLILYENST